MSDDKGLFLWLIFAVLYGVCKSQNTTETQLYGGSGGDAGFSFDEGRIFHISWSTETGGLYMGAVTDMTWQSDTTGTSANTLGSETGTPCPVISLPYGEYIDSYRVQLAYYNNNMSTAYVAGLAFKSSSNKKYICTVHAESSYDTQMISYPGYYLSGFKWRRGHILDAIGFQFTAITPNPTTNPTTATTTPTSSPTAAPHRSTNVAGSSIFLIIGSSLCGIVLFAVCSTFWCKCCKSKRVKNYKHNKIQKMKRIKDKLTDGARSRLNYFVEIKQKIDDKLKSESGDISNESLAFGVNVYISSITAQFKEVATLFTVYCFVHLLISAYFKPCFQKCSNTYMICCAVMIVLFLICQCILYYKNHTKVADQNQRNCCCCKWNGKYIINTIVLLILMITKDTYPFSCQLQPNMMYAFNIIILGTIIAYIQFKKEYNEYSEAENIDECISEIDSMKTEDLIQYKDEFEEKTKNVKYKKRQYVGYVFQLMAIRYQFEVSMVIVYTAIISVFQIIYEQCNDCKDNEGELWLRMISFVLFLALTVIIQCKINDSWLQRVMGFGVTFCMMYTAQTRTAKCFFEWTNIGIGNQICFGISWFVIVAVLVYELWKILKAKKPLNQNFSHEISEKLLVHTQQL
eukprot:495404_1